MSSIDDPGMDETAGAESVDRRMTAEQVLFLQHACHMMEQRKYKPNWPRVMFNRRFGFWPTIATTDVVPVEPTADFKAWVQQNSSKGPRPSDRLEQQLEALIKRYSLDQSDEAWLRALAARPRTEADPPSPAAGDLARRLSALLTRWQTIERELRNGRATVAARRLNECITELEAAIAPVGKPGVRRDTGHDNT